MSSVQPDVTTEESVSEDPIIEVEGATVVFPSGRGQATPLNNVSVEIERGEILGIIGESGSGKSMLGQSLIRAIPDPGYLDGRVTFYPEEGEPIEVTSLNDSQLRSFRWESIALVPQAVQSAFNPTRDVEAHFEETLAAHDADIEEGLERGREILESLNLNAENMMRSFGHELSGGQKQRVLIALSLILDPEVLIMEEPTASLDLLMQRQIINLLYDIREEYDITILFISHDLPLVTRFSERLGIMYAFDLVETGSAERVIKNPSHPYTRALLKAIPNLNAPVDTIRGIPGESPDPVNIPAGCSYHPRCPLADDRCEIEDPARAEIEDEHRVACFYHDQAADAVPLPFLEDYE